MSDYEEYAGLAEANLTRATKTTADKRPEERQLALAYAQTYALLAIAAATREGLAEIKRNMG
jgi:hypothetical protein